MYLKKKKRPTNQTNKNYVVFYTHITFTSRMQFKPRKFFCCLFFIVDLFFLSTFVTHTFICRMCILMQCLSNGKQLFPLRYYPVNKNEYYYATFTDPLFPFSFPVGRYPDSDDRIFVVLSRIFPLYKGKSLS